MTDYRAQLEAAVRAVRFLSPDRYTWFGSLRKVRRNLPSESRRRLIQYSLEDDLYFNFYCFGEAKPAPPVSHLAPARDPSFAAALSEANAGHGYWQAGWRVGWHNDEAAIATRDGLSVLAPLAECRIPDGASLSPGLEVDVRRGKELPSISPGHYTACSDVDLPARISDTGIVRFYWNLGDPAEAVRLVQSLTTTLNAEAIPFRLKAGDHPAMFERADPAVLYISDSDYDRALVSVDAAYGLVAASMRPQTPAFTKRLAPGLGFAEDPGGGMSFGRHRCALIARALAEAAAQALTGVEARMELVERHFEDAGLTLAQPYLNAGSVDAYAELSRL